MSVQRCDLCDRLTECIPNSGRTVCTCLMRAGRHPAETTSNGAGGRRKPNKEEGYDREIKETAAVREIATIRLWRSDERDLDGPERWHFEIETEGQGIWTFGEDWDPDDGRWDEGTEFLTPGAAIDAASKWCSDRGLVLMCSELGIPVLRKGRTCPARAES